MKKKFIYILIPILMIGLYFFAQNSIFAVAQTTWNRITDSAAGDNLTSGIGNSGWYIFDGADFNRVRGDIVGIDVDITRMPAAPVVSIGNSAPANDFANPATALNTWKLLGLFDGATWDMMSLTIHGDDVSSVMGATVANFGYTRDGTNQDRIRQGSAAFPGAVLVHQSSNSSTNITTNTSTLVKSSPGFLNMLVINATGQNSAVAIYDDVTSPCNTGLVQTLPTDVTFAVKLEHQYVNGICALTTGDAVANISVLYR